MQIISVVPRGYCQGVVRAIKLARDTALANPGKTITMLGMIVHNRYVVDACTKMGIRYVEDRNKTRLELLDEIQEGIVIFTAHGVSDEVRRKAEVKGLTVVDATCPDVTKTHVLARDHALKGDVIYIGKKNHPESEGTVSLSLHIHLVTDENDIPDDLENVLITNQTTLSITDTQKLIEACLRKYPDAVVAEEVCNATRMRQEALMKLQDIDCLFVVGDPHSNNSFQLKKIGSASGIPETYLIESAEEIEEDMIRNKNRIAVTSGSSTPNALTTQVIDFLKHYAETGDFTRPSAKDISIL